MKVNHYLDDIMKIIFSGIFLFACSLNLFTQDLPNSQINKIILTVEAFLNNEITPYNEYTIISVHEWNKEYHNGFYTEIISVCPQSR